MKKDALNLKKSKQMFMGGIRQMKGMREWCNGTIISKIKERVFLILKGTRIDYKSQPEI